MKSLVIIGAGGHGKVVADTALEMGAFNTISFVDARYPSLTSQLGLNVVGDDDSIPALVSKSRSFVIAIGDNRLREQFYQKLISLGANFARIIHPDATVSRFAEVLYGTVVFAGARINASAQIGQNVIVNTGAIIEHDCQIGSHSHIAPGAVMTGASEVGEMCLVGTGAVVLPGTVIGHDSIIGAGAVVNRNVPDGVTAKGIPVVW